MRGNAQRYGSRKPTRQANLNGLLMELTMSRDHLLPTKTVDELMARHGTDRKTTLYHLTIAQNAAARRMAGE